VCIARRRQAKQTATAAAEPGGVCIIAKTPHEKNRLAQKRRQNRAACTSPAAAFITQSSLAAVSPDFAV